MSEACTVDRLPGWRRLVDAMIERGVEPGAFFADDWIDEQLGLAAPQTVAEVKRYELQRLRGLTRAELALEERGLRTLHRDGERKGYVVPTAQEQIEHGVSRYQAHLRAGLRYVTRQLSMTDRAQLTDGQRAKLDDITGRIADMRSFARRQNFDIRKLLPAPKRDDDTP